jgi:hypothetical protein
MATATRTKTKKVVELTEDTVTLVLSQDEAKVIADILISIAGPQEGRRQHADSIRQALSAAGITWLYPDYKKEGSITFKA